MDDVKPGKIPGRRGHVREGHFRVAPATCGISVGGARGWTIWRTVHEHVQAVQAGFREISLSHLSSMATPKHGKNCSICKGGLQVTLRTEQAGFVCPASQRSTTIEDVLIHFLDNAFTGPGCPRAWC
jgi:hypothetical protein